MTSVFFVPAYYGGILGLFIGYSFISTIEVVYFFLVRLISDYSKKAKVRQHKSDKVASTHNFKNIDVHKLGDSSRKNAFIKRRNSTRNTLKQ